MRDFDTIHRDIRALADNSSLPPAERLSPAVLAAKFAALDKEIAEFSRGKPSSNEPSGDVKLLHAEQIRQLQQALEYSRESEKKLAEKLKLHQQKSLEDIAAARFEGRAEAAAELFAINWTPKTRILILLHSIALVFSVMGLIGQLYSTEDDDAQGLFGVDYTDPVMTQCYFALAVVVTTMSFLGLWSTCRMTQVDVSKNDPDKSLISFPSMSHMSWGNRILAGLGVLTLIGSFVAIVEISIAAGMEADTGGLIELAYESNDHYLNRGLAMGATFIFSGVCLATAKWGGEIEIEQAELEAHQKKRPE